MVRRFGLVWFDSVRCEVRPVRVRGGELVRKEQPGGGVIERRFSFG